MKKVIRDTVCASLYQNPTLCKGLSRPQQELRERDIDIPDDLLL
jgi:hypothetical protein